MYPAVKDVKIYNKYVLYLLFSNGEARILDMNPYLDFGIFSELKDENIFKSVKVSFDSIEWGNQADLDPEFVYKKSIPLPIR